MTILNEQHTEVRSPAAPPRVRRYRSVQEQEPRSRVNTALIYIVVAGLITAVGLLYLFQTNYVAGLGYEMSQLERERTALALRNEQLNYSIARYESLSAVESVAIGRLGMQESQNEIFITLPRPASDELPEPTPVETGDPSLIERVWQGLTGSASAVSDGTGGTDP